MRYAVAIASLVLFAVPLQAVIILNEVMNREEQHRTGVDMLNHFQKAALEAWLNKNFIAKASLPSAEHFYLSENVSNGTRIILSNGAKYDIAPQDVATTSVWLTPIPIRVSSSGDIDYPFLLTNLNSGASVKARMAPLDLPQQAAPAAPEMPTPPSPVVPSKP